MLDLYNICASCDNFVEFRKHLWRDINGSSFGWVVYSNGGVVHHQHSPANPETYSAGKYSSLMTEVLSVMGDLGYEDDSFGNTDDFGYYESFPDYNAIVMYDSQGFVYSTVYESHEVYESVWEKLVIDCREFYDEQDYREQQELEYERRDIEYDEYDSDLYDIYED